MGYATKCIECKEGILTVPYEFKDNDDYVELTCTKCEAVFAVELNTKDEK
jgi:hypothetical protein